MPANASTPCVGFGRTPLSHVVGLSEWTADVSAARCPSPDTMSTYSRNGSSGFRIGENSKLAPSCAGVHLSMIAPCGRYTNPRRAFGFATVLASTVPAGTIASSSGSANEAPAAFRNVRRCRCFRVRNMGPRKVRTKKLEVGTSQRALRTSYFQLLTSNFLQKRRAFNDAEHDRREAIVLRRSVACDLTHDRHV